MKVTLDKILLLSFLSICIIFLCNLNGVLYLTIGLRAPFSPIILVLSIIIIGISLFIKQYKIKGWVLILYLVFYILYLYLGLVVLLFDDSLLHPKVSILEILRTYLSSIIIILAAYFVTLFFISKNNISGLLRILLFTSLVSILVAAISPFIGLTDFYSFASGGIVNNERVSGLFGNPNETGAFAIYFLTIVLTCYSYFRKWTIWLLPLVGLAYYVSFMSFSRAALILINLIFLLYIIMHLKRINKFRLNHVPKTVVFLVIVLFSAAFGSSKFYNYISNLSHSQKTRIFQTFQLVGGKIDKSTTSHRSEVYSYVLKQIESSPFLGYGLGTFHRIMNLPGANKLGTHNTHILIWAESGILPLLLFTLALFILGLRAWHYPNPSIGFFVAAIVITYFVNVSGTGHNGLDDRISNLLIGISIALLMKRKSFSNIHEGIAD